MQIPLWEIQAIKIKHFYARGDSYQTNRLQENLVIANYVAQHGYDLFDDLDPDRRESTVLIRPEVGIKDGPKIIEGDLCYSICNRGSN